MYHVHQVLDNTNKSLREQEMFSIRTAAKTKNQLVYFDHQNVTPSLCQQLALVLCFYQVIETWLKHGFKPISTSIWLFS